MTNGERVYRSAQKVLSQRGLTGKCSRDYLTSSSYVTALGKKMKRSTSRDSFKENGSVDSPTKKGRKTLKKLQEDMKTEKL